MSGGKPVKIAGLWRPKNKGTRVALSGPLDKDALEKMQGMGRVVIFAVDPEWKKENPNRPDFDLCVEADDRPSRSTPEPKEEEMEF